MTDSIGPAWFSRLGLPLSVQERAGIAAMLQALDFAAGAPIAGAASWEEAAQAVRADEADSRGWNAEEDERERLWNAATQRLAESDLLARVAAAVAESGAQVHRAAALAAARAGTTGSGLVRAATDAALLALHQQALAITAGVADGHYFLRKFELFADGRWPLGLSSGKYVVF